jgi:hypothetical protein
MSTPDRRLDDLRRQRALVQQQLARLDGEIAAAESAASATVPAPAATAPANAVPDTDAEAILDQYRHTGPTLRTQVRNGCLFYASGALALLLLGAFVLSFLLRHRSPV